MTGPRVVPTPPTSEAAFQKELTTAAKLFGWTCCHSYRGKVGKGAWRTNTTVVGFPDLMLYRPGEHFYAELKTDTGKLSAAQVLVIEDLRASNCEVQVYAPRDWDAVVERLSR